MWGAVHGGTAESRVVPLRKKSDIREGRGPKGWGGVGVYTCRNYVYGSYQKGEKTYVCVCEWGGWVASWGGGP